MRNASQKKNEFLRNLQEIEQITVNKKMSHHSLRTQKNEDLEVDGTVHFTEDESIDNNGKHELHQDLELIKKELLEVIHSFYLFFGDLELIKKGNSSLPCQL